MSSFGVFDLITGDLVLPMQATDLAQVQIQAPAGSGRVVLAGDFSQGKWRLGDDGWPSQLPTEVPAVTPDQVKYVARKLLEATDWKVTRHRDELEAGEPTSLSAEEYAALQGVRRTIRQNSNAIEQMDPIPADFWQDHYWSAS